MLLWKDKGNHSLRVQTIVVSRLNMFWSLCALNSLYRKTSNVQNTGIPMTKCPSTAYMPYARTLMVILWLWGNRIILQGLLSRYLSIGLWSIITALKKIALRVAKKLGLRLKTFSALPPPLPRPPSAGKGGSRICCVVGSPHTLPMQLLTQGTAECRCGVFSRVLLDQIETSEGKWRTMGRQDLNGLSVRLR